VVSFTPPVALLPGEEPPVSIGWEAESALEPVWRLWRENLLLLQGTEPPFFGFQPAAQSLYWLSYLFSFSLKGWGKPRNSSVRIAHVPTDIRIRYLPNISLERYRYCNRPDQSHSYTNCFTSETVSSSRLYSVQWHGDQSMIHFNIIPLMTQLV
jgi:hypothetical protein